MRQDGARTGELGRENDSFRLRSTERDQLLILGVLRTRLQALRTKKLVGDLAHEEYEGRNVLSIVARDEYDGLEEVTYHSQLVFRRHRSTSGEEHEAVPR